MSDVRKHAERLMELEQLLLTRGWRHKEKIEYELHRQMVTDYARAYLAECDAHERTLKQLAEAVKALHKVCGYTSGTTAFEDAYVRIAAEEAYEVANLFLASIEQKEDDERCNG